MCSRGCQLNKTPLQSAQAIDMVLKFHHTTTSQKKLHAHTLFFPSKIPVACEGKVLSYYCLKMNIS